MKKNNNYSLYVAGLLILATACQRIAVEEDFIETAVTSEKAGVHTLTALLESRTESKTYLEGPVGGIYYPYWSPKDAVAVYADDIPVADQYVLSSGDGTDKAVFSGSLTGSRLVGLYPYSDKTDKGISKGVLTLELPAEQQYAENSFGPGAFPMLAVSDNNVLSFKNLCAVLKVSMTGSVAVQSIRFVAHDSWKCVSGKATVRTDFETVPELTMTDEGAPYVTLQCGSVQLDPTTPTDFFIVIPAGTYYGGFSVEIKTYSGTVTRSTNSDVTFERSQFRAIPVFECAADGEIDPDNLPYNQIWYCSGWGNYSFNSSDFDRQLLSQEKKDDYWILTFDGPVTQLGSGFNRSNLTEIHLPNSIESLASYAFNSTSISEFRTPDNLKSVGQYSFTNCENLSRIYGKWATEDEKALLLEDGTLAAYAYASMGDVLNIPDGTTAISRGLFSSKSGVKRVHLPASLTALSSNCFSYCENLESYSGDSPVIYDAHSLVNGDVLISIAAKGLTEYEVPEGVRVLGDECLTRVASLKKLILPGSLGDIYATWKDECPNLEFFEGPLVTNDHHLLIYDVDYVVAATTICPVDYTLPPECRYVWQRVFKDNVTTERLVFPDEILYIGNYCCMNMSHLKTAQLPASLAQLGYGCFRGCDELETVYVRSATPPALNDDEYYFWGHDGLTIYVPLGAENLYKQASGWSLYADYIQGYAYPDLEKPDYYISSDFSADGTVHTVQTAAEGAGINLVLMGDAFSDRQIADGTYESVMKKMSDAFFSEEPYTSFQDYFNVYYVDVVSATEGYEHGGQTLGGWFGDGTQVGGNDNRCEEYALKVLSEEQMDDALIIIAMNSDAYAGTCWMYYPSSGDYGRGLSLAYFPMGSDDSVLAQLVHHEAGGHGFAKLADEYAYESMGRITDDVINNRSRNIPYGWWKNVDFTDDPETVKWARFLADERYQYDGLGCFEGGFTYWTGVWRPTDTSIMRYNTGGFNAPSREAIWYRIHKLAFGESWEYDYEEFVAYDAINRKTEASAAGAGIRSKVPASWKPTHAPVVIPMGWKEARSGQQASFSSR